MVYEMIPTQLGRISSPICPKQPGALFFIAQYIPLLFFFTPLHCGRAVFDSRPAEALVGIQTNKGCK